MEDLVVVVLITQLILIFVVVLVVAIVFLLCIVIRKNNHLESQVKSKVTGKQQEAGEPSSDDDEEEENLTQKQDEVSDVPPADSNKELPIDNAGLAGSKPAGEEVPTNNEDLSECEKRLAGVTVPVDNKETIVEDKKSPVAKEVSNIVLANNEEKPAGEVPVDNTNGEESSVDPLDNINLVTGSPVLNEELAIEIPSFAQQGSSLNNTEPANSNDSTAASDETSASAAITMAKPVQALDSPRNGDEEQVSTNDAKEDDNFTEESSNTEDIPPSEPKPATTTGTQIPEPVSPPLANFEPLVEDVVLPDDSISIEETIPSQDNSTPVYSSCAVFNPTGPTDELVFQVSSFQNHTILLPNAYCIWETSIEEIQDNSEYEYVCGSSTVFKSTTPKEEAVYSQFTPDCEMQMSETSFLSDIEPDFEDDLDESENSAPGVPDLNENSYTTNSFDQEVADEQEIMSTEQSDTDNKDQNSSLSLVSQPDSGFSPSLDRSFSSSSLNRSFSLERSSSLEHFSSLDQPSSLDPTSDDQPMKMTCANAHDSSPPKKKRRGKKKS